MRNGSGVSEARHSSRERKGTRTHGVPLASRMRLSRAMTCPHGSSMGGFCAVDCSFETGHAKIEWYRYGSGSGISTCGRKRLRLRFVGGRACRACCILWVAKSRWGKGFE